MLVTSWTAQYTGGDGHHSKPSEAAKWQRAVAWCGGGYVQDQGRLPLKETVKLRLKDWVGRHR